MSHEHLEVLNRYETVVAYVYPMLQNCRKTHSVARDKAIECLFDQVDYIIQAGKSGHISKLYAADANLAALRFYLRFHCQRTRAITPHQHEVALRHVAEVGSMIGAWIKTKQQRKGG